MKSLAVAIGLVALLAVGAVLTSGGSQTDSARLRYLPESNSLRTISRFGTARTVTARWGKPMPSVPIPAGWRLPDRSAPARQSGRDGCTPNRCLSCVRSPTGAPAR